MLAAITTTLTGCQGPTRTPAATDAPSVSPTTAPPPAAAGHLPPPNQSPTAARTAVETAYRRFWTIASAVDSQPPSHWRPALATVAAEPLLSRILDGLTGLHAAGRRQYGHVTPHPTTIELSATTATLLDCQDASTSGEADTDTGLPASTGRPRTPVAAVLTRGADGRWRVSDARYLPDTC
jgi:hypothetical protein